MHPADPPDGRAAAGVISQPSEADIIIGIAWESLIRRGIGVLISADDLPAIVDIERHSRRAPGKSIG